MIQLRCRGRRATDKYRRRLPDHDPSSTPFNSIKFLGPAQGPLGSQRYSTLRNAHVTSRTYPSRWQPTVPPAMLTRSPRSRHVRFRPCEPAYTLLVKPHCNTGFVAHNSPTAASPSFDAALLSPRVLACENGGPVTRSRVTALTVNAAQQWT
jgi:hypothetical protein